MDGAIGAEREVRVGVDLVSVEEVARSIETFGQRYLERVFTEEEVSSSCGDPGARASSLAARFAAKEAVIKVLRRPECGMDLRSIQVRRHGDGHCEMELSGVAGRLAEEAGTRSMAVSLSHESGIAAAVVVAVCETGDTAAS